MPLNTREHTCAAWTKNVLPPSGQIRKNKKQKKLYTYTLHLHCHLQKTRKGLVDQELPPSPKKKKTKKLLKVFVSQPTKSQLQLGGKH
jgi:hypothetical protein